MKSLENIDFLAIAVTMLLLLQFLGGCAQKNTGQANRGYGDNYRFVPSIHVEDNSFGASGSEYFQCSYDQYNAGYWCIVND
jgi:hypothetical protein